MSDIFHPDRRILKDLRIIQDQLPAHQGNVICCRIMFIRIRQSTAVDKMCIFHPKPFCPGIHLFYKSFLTSCDMFCHRNTGIISRCNDDALDHRLHILRLAFFQKNLRTAHGFRMCACRHSIGKFQASVFQVIEDQQERHDFCDTRRTPSGVFVFLIKNRFCLRLHQDTTWCRDLHRLIFFCMHGNAGKYNTE